MTDSLLTDTQTDFIICPMLLMHWADNKNVGRTFVRFVTVHACEMQRGRNCVIVSLYGITNRIWAMLQNVEARELKCSSRLFTGIPSHGSVIYSSLVFRGISISPIHSSEGSGPFDRSESTWQLKFAAIE